jgi:hypothetical protein
MERQSVCGMGELNYIISFNPVNIFQNNIKQILLERDCVLKVPLSYGKQQSVQHSFTYCKDNGPG